jgi:hypothetical protein
MADGWEQQTASIPVRMLSRVWFFVRIFKSVKESSSLGGETFPFFRNAGKGGFLDATYVSRLGAVAVKRRWGMLRRPIADCILGLGDAAVVEKVEILWPSGTRKILRMSKRTNC